MFGSFGAGFGSFGAGVGGLLPSFANITSWLKAPTADGKTLANSKGADATLTAVNCLQFNEGGAADYVALAKDITTTTSWENEFDVNWSNFGSASSGVSFLSSDDQTRWWRINGVDGNNLFIEGKVGNTSFREVNISSDVSLSLNTTYRIKTVWSGTSVALYIDGVLKNTYNWGNNVESNTFGNIGRPTATSGTAKISNWKFYNNGILEAHLPLAEGSGTKAFDVSGKGNRGVINNSTWTTANVMESWNHEYGFDTDIFKGYAGYWDLAASGNGTWVANESNLTLTGNTAGSGKFRQTVEGMASGDTLVVSGTIVQTGGNGSNADVAISSASAGWAEGTVYLGGSVGTYNFSTTLNANASTCDIQFITLAGANVVMSNLKFTVVKKIPALNTKTKQVVTFDGAADHVDFASALLNSASTFTVRVDINKYERTVGSNAWVVGGQADKNFGLNKDNYIFYRDDDNTYLEFDGSGGTTDTSNLDLDGKSIVIKGSSDTIELFIDTVSYGTVTAGSGKGLFYAARYGLGYSTTAHAFKGSLSRVALWNTANNGQDLTTALVNHEFQSDIGTNTVQDTTTNNNDGTVTVGSGGTATFWGTRAADTAGSLVSADYATGNTTISNPAGFVHNGSECGVAMATNSLTSAQLFAIDNASATETFVRKDNGNIVQILDYSSALTGDDLTRTRSYVG